MRERVRVGTVVAAVAFGLLASARVGAEDAPKKENTAIMPVPRQGNWMKRHDKFVEIAKGGGVDVLFLGDSITDAWRNKGAKGGIDIFKEEFVPLKAANFGIGGDRTQHVLWRLQNGELDGIQPKVLMLMIGTNNLRDNSAAEIADGVKAIVKEVHKRSPKTKVLLLGVFPRGHKPGQQREKIKKINDSIAKLDDGGKMVKYLDIGDKFLEKDGTLPKEIMHDSLHLTAKGYRIWADAVKEPIKQLLGEK